MKNKFLKIGATIIISCFVFGAFSLSILSYSQGNDPIVTLSYLTEIILPQMKKDIVAEVAVQFDNSKNEAENNETTDNITVGGNENSQEDKNAEASEPVEASTGTYTLLELENGQRVYTNSILEFIVRPGSDVCVISPFDAQGVADITNGTEHLDGVSVPINAYCLIPRGSDGRGIEVVNEKSYILVRGDYYIG